MPRLASFCHWVDKKTLPAKIVFVGNNWFLPTAGKNHVILSKLLITN